jgi:hypothetical protein
MVTKEEVLAELEMSDIVKITMSDGYTFEIGVASNWIGGSENGFMCELLGNIEYSTKESCVNAVFAYLKKEKMEIEEVDS